MKTFVVCMVALMLSVRSFAQTTDTVASMPAQQLGEVTVTAKEPAIKYEADRIIYNIGADPRSKASSLLEVMRRVPHLSIDGEERVLLNGSAVFKIFIDGKPSGLMAGDPAAVLRSMPATAVKSIEVIINPPAKYDAEGLAGIINIVTNRQRYGGYRGSVNARVKGPAGGPGAGGSFAARKGKLDLSFIGGISDYHVPQTAVNHHRTSTGKDASSLDQHIVSVHDRTTVYEGAELSYEIDSLHLLSARFNGRSNRSTGKVTHSATFAASGANRYYELNNEHHKTENSAELAAHYQRGFKDDKEKLLTVSYQYLKETTALFNDLLFFNQVNYATQDNRQYNAESFKEHTAQFDYVQGFRKLIIEGGIKGIFRENSSGFEQQYIDSATGIYVPDLLRTNVFACSQHIFCAYNSYNWQSAAWQVKAGLRAEATFLNGNLSRRAITIRHHYYNVLPSVSISRKLNDHCNLSFSFSSRIQRPSTAELNPFADQSNPNFITAGNPYLQPIKSNVVQLSYFRTGNFTLDISVGGMFFRNVFDAFPDYDSTANIVISRMQNIGGGQVWKTNLFLSYPFAAHWTLVCNSDIRHVTVKGTSGDGVPVKNSGVDVYFSAAVSRSFTGGWQVNSEFTCKKGGILLPVGRTNGFVTCSFCISKTLLQQKLAVSACFNNPFNRYRYIRETIDGGYFRQTAGKQVFARQFTLGLNYRFGKLRENIRKNTRDISNDDGGGG